MSNEEPRFGALSSSVDPAKMGEMVTGFIITIAAVIIFGAAQFGVKLFPQDVEVIAANVGNIVTLAAIAYGSMRTLFGAVRKLAVRFAEYTK